MEYTKTQYFLLVLLMYLVPREDLEGGRSSIKYTQLVVSRKMYPGLSMLLEHRKDE